MRSFVDAPLHARAVIGGFCSARTLQSLLCASRAAAERFSEPAVLQQVALTCHYCDAHFTAATNAPDACAYHPCDAISWQDSQGNETVRHECCADSYAGNHWYPGSWDPAKAAAIANSPPCVVDAHYAQQPWHQAAAGCPPPGAKVEVLRRPSRGEPVRLPLNRNPQMPLDRLCDREERGEWVPGTLLGYAVRRRDFSLAPVSEAKPAPWNGGAQVQGLLDAEGRVFTHIVETGKGMLVASVGLDGAPVAGTVPLEHVRWPRDAQPHGGLSHAALAQEFRGRMERAFGLEATRRKAAAGGGCCVG